MMKGFLIVIILGCLGCDKFKRIRFLDGKWKLEKVLLKDGSYIHPNESFEFVVSSKDDAKGIFTHYLNDNKDTVVGEFQIINHGDDFVMKTDKETTYRIEDMDKESFIFHFYSDVSFLTKLK